MRRVLIKICVVTVSSRDFKFQRADIEALLNLAAKESVFLFNCDVYKQVDGVAMAFPLGPTLANIFMAYHENPWLSQRPATFKPIIYRRYVAYTFLIFSKIPRTLCRLMFAHSLSMNTSVEAVMILTMVRQLATSASECESIMAFLPEPEESSV